MASKISLIIPSRNSAKTLGSVLASIKAADSAVDEILVIDDCSTDESAKIAEAAGATVYRLGASAKKGFGPGYARLYGARKSIGRIIVFVDSDVCPSSDYLKIIRDELESADSQVGGVGGKYVLPESYCSIENKLCVRQEENYWNQFAPRAEVEVLYGGICAFVREAWLGNHRSYQELSLFSGIASGEDCFVCNEINGKYKLVYRDDLIGFHHTDIAQRYFFRNFQQAYSRTRSLMHTQSFGSKVIDSYRIKYWIAGYFLLALAVAGSLLFSVGSPWFFASTGLAAIGAFWLASAPLVTGLKWSLKLIMIRLILIQQLAWILGTLKAFGLPVRQILKKPFSLGVSAYRFLWSGKVSKLFLFVTNRCNFSCSWCLDKDRAQHNLGAELKAEISLADIERLCATSKQKIPYLVITGGEPFLRHDVDQIVLQFYRQLKTRFVTLVSNGAYPEKTAEQVERMLIACPDLQLNMQLTVSDIDSEHDKIRGPRSFELIKKTEGELRRLKKIFPGLIFTVSSQLGDDNVRRYEQVIRQVKNELHPDEHFLTLIRETPKLISPESEAVSFLPAIIKSISEAYPRPMSLFQAFYNQVVQESILEVGQIRQNKHQYRPCLAGKGFATIYENGNVVICENRQDLVLGKIDKTNFSLDQILNSDQAKKARQKMLSEKCQCDWGCAVTQNLMADPVFLGSSLLQAILKTLGSFGSAKKSAEILTTTSSLN